MKRGDFGWLIVTRHDGDLHIWGWRPLHKWHEAVQFANDLAWEMLEWSWESAEWVGSDDDS